MKIKASGDKRYEPSKLKVNAIFRRLDLNADCKIAFNEFAEAIKPIDVYFNNDQVLKDEKKRKA